MRSFKDIHGNHISFEDKNDLDVELQTDIISNETTAYLVHCRGNRYKVDEEVYNAIAAMLNKL